jgi:hypothetical protein
MLLLLSMLGWSFAVLLAKWKFVNGGLLGGFLDYYLGNFTCSQVQGCIANRWQALRWSEIPARPFAGGMLGHSLGNRIIRSG